MHFFNRNGKKYSFVLLLVILQNAAEIKGGPQNVEESSVGEEAELMLKDAGDVSQLKMSKSLEDSAAGGQESEQYNLLDDGFIVIPLKSRRITTEGLSILPMSKSVETKGGFPEIMIPSMKELDQMKEAALERRKGDNNKENIEVVEYPPVTTQAPTVTVAPPASRRFLTRQSSRLAEPLKVRRQNPVPKPPPPPQPAFNRMIMEIPKRRGLTHVPSYNDVNMEEMNMSGRSLGYFDMSNRGDYKDDESLGSFYDENE